MIERSSAEGLPEATLCYDPERMTLLARAFVSTSALAALVACAPPQPVDGGGMRGAFEGELTVIVVDEASAPIAGATVLAGEGADARALGETGADGVLRVGEAVDVITATAPDRSAVSVAGAQAALVTIVLPLRSTAPAPIVLAHVPGWAELALDGASYLHARAGAFTDVALDRDVPQPSDAVTECTRTGDAIDGCDLRFAVAPSTEAIFVAIVRGTDPGTPEDESDDALEPVALAVSDAIAVSDGLDVPLSIVDRADLVEVDVAASGAPEGLDAVVGVPGASMSDGVIVWPFRGPGLIPRVHEDGASHWAVGDARSPDARSRTVVRAQRFRDGDATTVDAWLDPPAAIEIESGVVSASGAQDRELRRVTIAESGGALAWSAYVLDGRASIAPPAALALPPSGTLEVTRTLLDGQSSESELSFARVDESWTQRASRALSFDGCPFIACR